MKIGHISDLHVSTVFRKNNFEEIKMLINKVVNSGIDHLCITGDLTDNADHEDFELLRNHLKNIGYLDGNKTSVVIGNHDIFGGIVTPEDILNFTDRCRKTDFAQKVNEFVDFFSETFNNCVYQSKEKKFPYVKLIDDVMITGLNSIAEYSRIKNPFASNGRIKLEQIIETIDIFEKMKGLYKSSIVLVHHHFNKIKIRKGSTAANIWQGLEKQTMKLYKKKRLMKLFQMHNVDLILHGHYHEMGDYTRKGLRFCNSGASIKSYNKLNNLSAYIIDVNGQKIDTKLISVSPKGLTESIPLPHLKPLELNELKLAEA